MKRKNRILTLIDFSIYSETLVGFTAMFADLIHADVVFVNKVPSLVPALSDDESKKQIISIEKEEALEKLKALTENFFLSKIEYFVDERKILTILKELTNSKYFDWVIVGLKENGILKQIFIGSNTIKIIDFTQLLTVAVPLQKEIIAPKGLIIAVNYKYPLNTYQFGVVLDNLSKSINEIRFFSVLTKKDDESSSIEYLTYLKEKYKHYNPFADLFKGENVFEGIKDYMVNKSEFYLVVQEGSRSLTDHFFRKFLINELVYSGSFPLIIIAQ